MKVILWMIEKKVLGYLGSTTDKDTKGIEKWGRNMEMESILIVVGSKERVTGLVELWKNTLLKNLGINKLNFIF